MLGAADAALTEIERCAGAQFDPELVRLFIEVIRQQPHPILEHIPADDQSACLTLLHCSFYITDNGPGQQFGLLRADRRHSRTLTVITRL